MNTEILPTEVINTDIGMYLMTGQKSDIKKNITSFERKNNINEAGRSLKIDGLMEFINQ